MRLPRAWICSRCGFTDDLDPNPRTGAPQRCPCPHDEVTSRQRQHEVELRHRNAVARARLTDKWARMRRAS